MASKKQVQNENGETLIYNLLSSQIDSLTAIIKDIEKGTNEHKVEIIKQIRDIKENLNTMILEKEAEILKIINTVKDDSLNNVISCRETNFHPLSKKAEGLYVKIGIVIAILGIIGTILFRSIVSDAVFTVKKYQDVKLMEKYYYDENN